MKPKEICTVGKDGRDDIISFLSEFGIVAELQINDSGYSRVISFSVYGIDYRIIWYINQCTLMIGKHDRAACLPFKFIYFDTSYPLIGGNRSIGFAYERMDVKSIFESHYRYDIFRIPLEIEEKP